MKAIESAVGPSGVEPGEPLQARELLQLLSDGERASVEAANTDVQLRRGQEYLDLEELQRGVQRADGTPTNAGALLPRTAIHEDTWRRVLRRLQAIRIAGPAPELG